MAKEICPKCKGKGFIMVTAYREIPHMGYGFFGPAKETPCPYKCDHGIVDIEPDPRFLPPKGP
jgi:hypothetical protein